MLNTAATGLQDISDPLKTEALDNSATSTQPPPDKCIEQYLGSYSIDVNLSYEHELDGGQKQQETAVIEEVIYTEYKEYESQNQISYFQYQYPSITNELCVTQNYNTVTSAYPRIANQLTDTKYEVTTSNYKNIYLSSGSTLYAKKSYGMYGFLVEYQRL